MANGEAIGGAARVAGCNPISETREKSLQHKGVAKGDDQRAETVARGTRIAHERGLLHLCQVEQTLYLLARLWQVLRLESPLLLAAGDEVIEPGCNLLRCIACWHIAPIRGNAALRSLLEPSGH